MLSFAEAYKIAAEVHKNQTDKAGGPYIDFLKNVADYLKDKGEPEAALLIPKKMDAAGTLNALKNVYETVKAGLDAGKNDEELQQDLMDLAQKLGIKNAGVFNPLRTAVTGMAVSPPPFSCIRLLGKEESYRRIERAIAILEKEVNNG